MRIAEIDPSVGDVHGAAFMVPPFIDARHHLLQSVRKLAKRKQYNTIICVPWLRTGGADLVACLLAEAVSSICPGEHILLIRTEQSYFERPDWIPDGIEVIDASPVLNLISPAEAEDIFLALLLGLTPRRVFNVNSNLCWRVLARFGQRMGKRIISIHIYFAGISYRTAFVQAIRASSTLLRRHGWMGYSLIPGIYGMSSLEFTIHLWQSKLKCSLCPHRRVCCKANKVKKVKS